MRLREVGPQAKVAEEMGSTTSPPEMSGELLSSKMSTPLLVSGLTQAGRAGGAGAACWVRTQVHHERA